MLYKQRIKTLRKILYNRGFTLKVIKSSKGYSFDITHIILDSRTIFEGDNYIDIILTVQYWLLDD